MLVKIGFQLILLQGLHLPGQYINRVVEALRLITAAPPIKCCCDYYLLSALNIASWNIPCAGIASLPVLIKITGALISPVPV